MSLLYRDTFSEIIPLHGLIVIVDSVAFSFWPLVMASQDPSRHRSNGLTLFIVYIVAIKLQALSRLGQIVCAEAFSESNRSSDPLPFICSASVMS